VTAHHSIAHTSHSTIPRLSEYQYKQMKKKLSYGLRDQKKSLLNEHYDMLSTLYICTPVFPQTFLTHEQC